MLIISKDTRTKRKALVSQIIVFGKVVLSPSEKALQLNMIDQIDAGLLDIGLGNYIKGEVGL